MSKPMARKKCKVCGDEKTLNQFYKHRPGQYRNVCRACILDRNKRRSEQQKPDWRSAYLRAWK